MVIEATLLELVSAFNVPENSEQAIVDRVVDLLRGGDVRLAGSFRGVPLERLFADATDCAR